MMILFQSKQDPLDFYPIIEQMRPMAVAQVTTVTWVCKDYDSYLKIGPNRKKKGLDCWARQALFALKTTMIFWDFGFWDSAVLE